MTTISRTAAIFKASCSCFKYKFSRRRHLLNLFLIDYKYKISFLSAYFEREYSCIKELENGMIFGVGTSYINM